MQELRQHGVMAWSSLHQTCMPAALTYEVTEERGYTVARLRSLQFLESPSVPSSAPAAPSSPPKIRANVILFPSPSETFGATGVTPPGARPNWKAGGRVIRFPDWRKKNDPSLDSEEAQFAEKVD